MSRRRHARGFTLIEMMISVAIIGILSAVAIPNFIQYQLQVKTSEARTLMGGIITSQESFVSEFENYANITTQTPLGVPGLNKQRWPDIRCPDVCNRRNTQLCTSFDCIGFGAPANVYYVYRAPHFRGGGPIPPEYGAGAAADLDGDTTIGSFAYRSGNNNQPLGIVADGVSLCPASIPVTFLFTCTAAEF